MSTKKETAGKKSATKGSKTDKQATTKPTVVEITTDGETGSTDEVDPIVNAATEAVSEAPATEAVEEAPATEAPATEAPATEAVEEAPATEAVEEAPATEAPKAKKEPKIKVLSDKQTIKLTVATPVYSRKDARDKASMMRADSEVIVQQLIDPGPTGTSLVSVKKPNSKRIFYTPMENLTAQGVEFKPVEPKAETPKDETAPAVEAPETETAETENAPAVETTETENAPAVETHVEATMGEQEVAAVFEQDAPEMVNQVEANVEESVEA